MKFCISQHLTKRKKHLQHKTLYLFWKMLTMRRYLTIFFSFLKKLLLLLTFGKKTWFVWINFLTN